MTGPEDSARPLSVADLLARNGTIGSPPVGGRRRRRRRNGDGVSVAELTGEIPVVRPGESPESDDDDGAGLDQARRGGAARDEPDAGGDGQPGGPSDGGDAGVGESGPVGHGEVVDAEAVHPDRVVHDDALGAEQMSYDPVDEPVDLSGLADGDGAEELRSYLHDSNGPLFSGDTLGDDLARRGFPAAGRPEGGAAIDGGDHGGADADEGGLPDSPLEPEGGAQEGPGSPRRFAANLGNGAVALLQSLLAVALGAGLFIGFDQLWRWNRIAALVLTVLVVLTLAAAVRVVRKTEDTVSTLTAVAVGLLVTLGPLALQST